MTTTPLSVADVLDAAAADVAKGWTQDVLARDATGRRVDPSHPDAVCWCVSGAIMRHTGGASWDWANALGLVETVACKPGGIVDWNDYSRRTQDHVVTALRTAATLAREGEKT